MEISGHQDVWTFLRGRVLCRVVLRRGQGTPPILSRRPGLDRHGSILVDLHQLESYETRLASQSVGEAPHLEGAAQFLVGLPRFEVEDEDDLVHGGTRIRREQLIGHGDILTHQGSSGKDDVALRIQRSLRAVSVGSFLFQRGVTMRLRLHATDLHAIYLVEAAQDGLTAGELASSLGLTSGSTTAVIERLRRRSYVTRSQDTDDGRRVVVRLAETARTDLGQEYRTIERRVVAAIAGLSDAERHVVARFLSALVEDPHRR